MRVKKRDLGDTRSRIVAAAEELSCEFGPAKLSLEAVAARAGVSKGGLLYHFPSKHALLRAIVEGHVDEIRGSMEAISPGCLSGGEPLAAARAWVRAVRAKLCDADTTPSGIFAAIAEDPEFIAPLRAFREEMRAIFARCPDPDTAAVVYLACEGLVHERLTDPQGHDGAARDAVVERLETMLG